MYKTWIIPTFLNPVVVSECFSTPELLLESRSLCQCLLAFYRLPIFRKLMGNSWIWRPFGAVPSSWTLSRLVQIFLLFVSPFSPSFFNSSFGREAISGRVGRADCHHGLEVLKLLICRCLFEEECEGLFCRVSSFSRVMKVAEHEI